MHARRRRSGGVCRGLSGDLGHRPSTRKLEDCCAVRLRQGSMVPDGSTRHTASPSSNDSGHLMRTYTPKPGEITRTWHVIDATDVVLGRLASQTAILLRGKHKATFAPHVDGGDFVIVINASKVALTGNKRENKLAYRRSGYPGGLRAVAYSDLLEKHPERAIEKAVRGMLPKSSLARQQLTKLKVYAGAEHPHA